MSAQDDPQKTLEMRVAAIEDKLAQSTITADEMRAFQKVSALAGGAAPQASFFCASCVITISVPVSTPVSHNCARFVQQATTQGGGPGFGGLGQ